VQRLLVLVNGRYAATQCTTIQEPLVKFGIVPIAEGCESQEQSFASMMQGGSTDLSNDTHVVRIGNAACFYTHQLTDTHQLTARC
jgi:hypothetical protein